MCEIKNIILVSMHYYTIKTKKIYLRVKYVFGPHKYVNFSF